MPEVKICPDGMVRIDGAPLFKRIERADGVIILQFIDRDRMRSACRGSRFIEIPLTELVKQMEVKNE